jgi:hypothetical protein
LKVAAISCGVLGAGGGAAAQAVAISTDTLNAVKSRFMAVIPCSTLIIRKD